MGVRVDLAASLTPDDAAGRAICDMWPRYLQELARHSPDVDVNADVLSWWGRKREALLVTVGGDPAGFALVGMGPDSVPEARPTYAAPPPAPPRSGEGCLKCDWDSFPKGGTVLPFRCADYYLAEFYISPLYRRSRVALRAGELLRHSRPGRWVAFVLARNRAGMSYCLGMAERCARPGSVGVAGVLSPAGPALCLTFTVDAVARGSGNPPQ